MEFSIYKMYFFYCLYIFYIIILLSYAFYIYMTIEKDTAKRCNLSILFY